MSLFSFGIRGKKNQSIFKSCQACPRSYKTAGYLRTWIKIRASTSEWLSTNINKSECIASQNIRNRWLNPVLVCESLLNFDTRQKVIFIQSLQKLITKAPFQFPAIVGITLHAMGHVTLLENGITFYHSSHLLHWPQLYNYPVPLIGKATLPRTFLKSSSVNRAGEGRLVC